MKKINVIGTTGSGKSTFSKALAEKMGCKYIQMDQLFWKPNWGETPDEEFFVKIKQETSVDSWVLDGNYTRSKEIKWENVDTIIWIDNSYFRTFLQLLLRTINRAWTKQELWLGTGNISTFKKSFFSKDSILVWFFKSYKKNKIRYEKLMEFGGSEGFEDIQFIRLQGRKEATEFIQSISKCSAD